MILSSISDNDIKLLEAIKPFMSNNSQEMIDLTVNILQIFKPKEPNQKLNLDALTSFLSTINKSFETEKAAILNNKQNKEQLKITKDDSDLYKTEEKTDNDKDKINEDTDKTDIQEDENRSDKPANPENVKNLLNLIADQQKENKR